MHAAPKPGSPPELSTCVYLANRIAHSRLFDDQAEEDMPADHALLYAAFGLSEQDLAALCQRVRQNLRDLDRTLIPADDVRASWRAIHRCAYAALQRHIARLGASSATGSRRGVLLAALPPAAHQAALAVSPKEALSRISEGAQQALALPGVRYAFFGADGRRIEGVLGELEEGEMALTVPFDAGEWGRGTLTGLYRIEQAMPDAIQDGLSLFAALAGLSIMGICRMERLRALSERLAWAPVPAAHADSRLRDMNQMTAQIAHIFNNLFAGILGRTQLLLKRPGERDRMIAGLQTIEQTILKGKQIIQYLQLASQPDPAPLSEHIYLNRLITEVLDEQRPGLSMAGVEVSSELEDRLPPIMGRPEEVRLMMTQILQNAVEAMPEGGQLTVRTHRDGQAVVASVADTGPGIPDTVQPHIFDPFFTTKGPQSIGLGLSVARSVMSRHHGAIQVVSDNGQHTMAVMRFPLCIDPGEPSGSIASNGHSSTPPTEERV
jgi:signal transduction histidine kinase